MSCTVVAVVMVRCKSSHLCSIHVDACALTCVWCRRLPVAVSSRVAFAHPGVLVYDIVKARVVDLFVLSAMGLCALLILYALLRSSLQYVEGNAPIPAVPFDTAWLPYERLFRRSLGYVANLAELPALLISLRNTSNGELERRERMAARVRRTHYTLDGVMEQIARFLLTPKRADLHCRQLPISVRDA